MNNKRFILLPGPPRECMPMFNDYVLPALQQTQHQHKPLLKWRLFAFIWIIILAVLIIIMIARFYEKQKTAAWLQVPYLLWTLFATYLNFGVYLLNR